MDGIREMFGGFSGFKGRVLLAAGFAVFFGMMWNGGRDFLISSGPFAPAKTDSSRSLDWMNGEPQHLEFLHYADRYGESAVKVGVCFMIAVVVGSLMRVAFKTAVFLILLSVVVLWFLENRGYAEIWHQYYATVQDGGTWLSTRLGVMRQFLTEQLPSASAALAGFGFGLRK